MSNIKKQVRFQNISDSDSSSDSDSDSDSSTSSEESITTRKKRLQKEYNKQYYAKNKQKILSALLQKEPCTYCGKMVNHQNLRAHQRSSNCDGKKDVVKMIQEIKNYMEKKFG